MSHKGFSHIGLSTLDLDKTRDFYENVLGFKPVRCDTIKVAEGGHIRHIFFDTGRDQLLAFMEARDVPGVPAEYDAGINRGLGVPSGFYHFAFETGSEAALEEKTPRAAGQRRRGHRHRRSRLGQVDLLQRSERHANGVCVLHPECRDGRRCDDAGALQHVHQGHGLGRIRGPAAAAPVRSRGGQTRPAEIVSFAPCRAAVSLAEAAGERTATAFFTRGG